MLARQGVSEQRSEGAGTAGVRNFFLTPDKKAQAYEREQKKNCLAGLYPPKNCFFVTTKSTWLELFWAARPSADVVQRAEAQPDGRQARGRGRQPQRDSLRAGAAGRAPGAVSAPLCCLPQVAGRARSRVARVCACGVMMAARGVCRCSGSNRIALSGAGYGNLARFQGKRLT